MGWRGGGGLDTAEAPKHLCSGDEGQEGEMVYLGVRGGADLRTLRV